jgi:hypothetical protein
MSSVSFIYRDKLEENDDKADNSDEDGEGISILVLGCNVQCQTINIYLVKEN